MRNTIVAKIVTPLLMTGLTIGFIGCKSAPKMPWSKTAATSDVEAAAMAHSAPSLPADVAKQAEALAATTPSIDLTSPPVLGGESGGQAAPYSAAPAYTPPASASLASVPMPSQGSGAKATPTAYPSTGASPYSSAPAAVIAAATPTMPPAYQSTDQSANLGSVNMPYNPNAVPPARTVASATPVTPSVTAGRYGSSTVASTAPAYGGAAVSPVTPVSPVASAALPQLSGTNRYGGDRYGSSPVTTTSPVVSPAPSASVNLASTNSSNVAPAASAAPAYGSAPASSAPAMSVGGNRYATTPTVTPAVPSVTPEAAVTAAPVVASASVYRPGGTTSYSGAASGLPVTTIATRPQPADVQVPNVAAPGAPPEPSQAPRYR